MIYVSVCSLVILISLAAIHVVWALGSSWPAEDEESLAQMVLGSSRRMPPRIASWVVAMAMTGFFIIVMMNAGWLPTPFAAYILQIPLAGVMAIFLGRGLWGFFLDRRLRPSTIGTPFERLNLIYYSPLCMVLAILLAIQLVA